MLCCATVVLRHLSRTHRDILFSYSSIPPGREFLAPTAASGQFAPLVLQSTQRQRAAGLPPSSPEFARGSWVSCPAALRQGAIDPKLAPASTRFPPLSSRGYEDATFLQPRLKSLDLLYLEIARLVFFFCATLLELEYGRHAHGAGGEEAGALLIWI